MTTKDPSNEELRLLSEVVERRVSRTRTSWRVAGQPSTAAESRWLNAFDKAGWISTPGTALDLRSLRPSESIGATVTAEGRAVLTRCWTDWKPSTEQPADTEQRPWDIAPDAGPLQAQSAVRHGKQSTARTNMRVTINASTLFDV